MSATEDKIEFGAQKMRDDYVSRYRYPKPWDQIDDHLREMWRGHMRSAVDAIEQFAALNRKDGDTPARLDSVSESHDTQPESHELGARAVSDDGMVADFPTEIGAVFSAMSDGQEPLGAEFSAVYDENAETLYEESEEITDEQFSNLKKLVGEYNAPWQERTIVASALKEPVRTFESTFSAVTVLKQMFQPPAPAITDAEILAYEVEASCPRCIPDDARAVAQEDDWKIFRLCQALRASRADADARVAAETNRCAKIVEASADEWDEEHVYCAAEEMTDAIRKGE